MEDLTDSEKLLIAFLPVDKLTLNLEQINIGLFFEVLHLAKSIGSVAVKQNKTKLQAIYSSLKDKSAKPGSSKI